MKLSLPIVLTLGVCAAALTTAARSGESIVHINKVARMESTSPEGLWTHTDTNAGSHHGKGKQTGVRRFSLNAALRTRLLRNAPLESKGSRRTQKLVMSLPLPDGSFEQFTITESPITRAPVNRDINFLRSTHCGSIKDDDNLLYQSAPLTEAMEISGPVELELYFSTTAEDTDFFAMLVDIDERGHSRALTIGPGKLRARYLSGWETPSAIEPRKVYKANIELWDIAHRFERGHRIGLAIRSECFPASRAISIRRNRLGRQRELSLRDRRSMATRDARARYV